LAKFIIALAQVKTVSIVQISAVMSGRAKADSHYKRCQRFLRFFDLPFAEVACLVIKLLDIARPFVVSIDRIDWYLGQTPLNILMLSLVYKGVAFPLLWAVLEKKGCCDTQERIALLQKYLKLFGKDSLDFVTAGREFIGRDWFPYLRREKIPFRLRIRENLKVTTARGDKGEEVSLMGMRTAEGEYVIVASSMRSDEILQDYAQRWKIENLFGCLKSRGFCLEATRITGRERLEKLLALLTIVFCWAYLAGA
jgi:hypothetical protein